MSDQFPPDEFDEIAKRGGPVGVHRARRPWWSRLVAPVLVFLLAGAAAYVIATALWHGDVKTPQEPTPTISETYQETVTPTPPSTPTSTPTSSPPSSPTPTATIDFGAAVKVLNGAGITGLAGKNQQVLEGGGFTAVTAGNLTSSKPDENVVVYSEPDLRATAEEVARQLGIDVISLDVPTSSADVEVQLVTDPAA